MLRRLIATLLMILIMAGLSARASEEKQQILVFAAASLKGPLDEAATAFTERTGLPVAISYAGSQALARQIEAGAEAALVITADEDWMNWLDERHLIDRASRRDLLGNSLVMIAPATAPQTFAVEAGMDLRARLGEGRLALGDPGAVPAGKYAREALTALGLWEGVADRLLPAENVRVALSYVARGEAPLGIVYATDAKSEPSVIVAGHIPEGAHKAIVYPAAVAKRGGEAAAELLRYLNSAEGFATFQRVGFKRPGATD
ncbi:MAG: molybdate ABC transporter substrate-binding protein [Alphaproteobacteria bacterium]|nr:molybdate ABC transporter substrate-binding protein [Alphaproteobacteria bacterium]